MSKQRAEQHAYRNREMLVLYLFGWSKTRLARQYGMTWLQAHNVIKKMVAMAAEDNEASS